MSSPHSPNITDDDIVTVRKTFINVAPKKQTLRHSRSDSDLSNTSEAEESTRNSEDGHVIFSTFKGNTGAAQKDNHRVWGAVELSGSSAASPSSEEGSGSRAKRHNRQTLLDGVELCDMSSDAKSSDEDRSEEEGVDPAIGASTQQLSRGSAAHMSGDCKPCKYILKARGCSFGADCDFCHFFHTERQKPRPGKARRQKCKRLADTMQAAYRDDPSLLAQSMDQLSTKSDYMKMLMEKKKENPEQTSTGGDARELSVDDRRLIELERALACPSPAAAAPSE